MVVAVPLRLDRNLGAIATGAICSLNMFKSASRPRKFRNLVVVGGLKNLAPRDVTIGVSDPLVVKLQVWIRLSPRSSRPAFEQRYSDALTTSLIRPRSADMIIDNDSLEYAHL